MDQDGPSSRCLGSSMESGNQCKRNALVGHYLCRNHKQQEDGVTCSGQTLAGNRCLAGTIEGSVYCKAHSRNSYTRGPTVYALDNLGFPIMVGKDSTDLTVFLKIKRSKDKRKEEIEKPES